MYKNQLKTPSEIIAAAGLSAGLSIIISLTNIVLCTLALVYRYDCNAFDIAKSTGADIFLVTIIKVYFQDETCHPFDTGIDELTKSQSVFILTIMILAFAVVNLITAIALIIVVSQEDRPVQNLDIIAYMYVGTCFASLVIDLTVGVHFGMDYQAVTNRLSLLSPGSEINYALDTIRLGAFLLMTISLKGFIGYAMHIVILILLTSYIVKYKQNGHENEHAIHKLGALNAFDSPKRYEDPWHAQRNDVFMGYQRGSSLNRPHEEEPPHAARGNPLNQDMTNNQKRVEDPWNLHRNDMFMGYPRGAQVNPAFNHDNEPPRVPIKEKPMSDNKNNKRPESWLHNQIDSGPGLSSRPFSYLEEPKRPIPVKPPITPTNEPQWRRDAWPPAPPVPDPDYSPPPRRLKSALKPNYL